MPASAFLKPSAKKYPVKAQAADGVWEYRRELLLAAARRARLEGEDDLAREADHIRLKEFGEAKGDAVFNEGDCSEMDAYTHNEARRLFEAGKIDQAWEKAKEDEGLLPGVTKEKWVAEMRKIVARNPRNDAAHTKGRVRIKETGKLVDVTMGETKVWDANGNEWAYSEVEKQGNGRSDAGDEGFMVRNYAGTIVGGPSSFSRACELAKKLSAKKANNTSHQVGRNGVEHALFRNGDKVR